MALHWTQEQYDEFMKRNGRKREDRNSRPQPDDDTEKPSKYRNKKVVVDGITFDSQKEAKFYEALKLLKLAGEVKEFTLQPEFILFDGYIRKRDNKKIRPIKYIADFRVVWADGRVEIIDVKPSSQFKTRVYQLKRKLLEGRYPDIFVKEIYD